MQTGELTGYWWLPEQPDTQVAGTVRLGVAGDAELSLVGHFGDMNDLQTPSELPSILGIASGKLITLIECTRVGWNITIPGTATSTYHPKITLLGAHVPSRQRLMFETASASWGDLHAWTATSGFSQELQVEGDRLVGLTVRYRTPAVVEADIPGAHVRLAHGLQSQVSNREQITLREKVVMEIALEAPVDFEHLMEEYVSPLWNFVTFGVGQFVPLLSLTGTLSRPNELPGRRRVEVVFEPSNTLGERRTISVREMLFTLADLREDFSEFDFLATWCRRQKELKPVWNLYFATLSNPGMYVEQRFLSLAQAAESYHRATNARQILDVPHFRAIRQLLCAIIDGAQINASAASALKSKFNYINEIPLKQRLGDLILSEEPLVHEVIPDTESFVRTVGNTRNYLTHYDQSLKARAAHGMDLYILSEQLQSLLQLVLLREAGFSSAKRAEIVRRQASRRVDQHAQRQ